MARILIVDDDADLARITARFLETEGFNVDCAPSAEAAYSILTSTPFDLILLDINLPADDGFTVCQELRRTSTVPIIFASARTSETDRIAGLDVGGDDYLPKPYSLRELLSHVRALLRRAAAFAEGVGGANTLHLGAIELDEATRIVRKEGAVVGLSPKEFDVLHCLMRASGTVLSKERILAEVWGAFSDVEPQTVAVHVSWLRAKLEDDPTHPRYLRTVRGKGYAFGLPERQDTRDASDTP